VQDRPALDLLISTGDPAGVGPEICLAALRDLGPLDPVRPVLVGDARVLGEAADLVAYPRALQRIDSLSGPRASAERTEVLHVAFPGTLQRGRVSAEAGENTYQILAACSRLCLRGEAGALVTAPFNKASLEAAGRGALGHTELLARLAGVDAVETVFCLERLRIFFLTRHLSLRDALARVRREPILAALIRMDRVLRDLGGGRPRLGVPGLNPHCGEGGLFGREEIEEIAPAVADARAMGLAAQGPIGADSIFHLGLAGALDAILSLYHDQGHIAAKTRDFHGTITLTLGLPYLRTSVDHGTGFDIAWQGIANPESMVRAVRLAVDRLRATLPGPT